MGNFKRKISLICNILFSVYDNVGEDVWQIGEGQMLFKDKNVSILFADIRYQLPPEETKKIGFGLEDTE